MKEEGSAIVRRGRTKAGNQQYSCKHCGKWFVETAGTPLYRRRLQKLDLVEICRLLAERKGIRAIERITGHHRDTISSLLDDMTAHKDYVERVLLNENGFDQNDLEEIWVTIRNRRRRQQEE